MSQFPDEAHLSSRAGVYPGNNGSAGKEEKRQNAEKNSFSEGSLD